jgi:two-component sensor histidine kinase
LIRLGFVHRGIVSQRLGFPGQLAWALAAIGVPSLVRLSVSPLVDNLPYLTFFPAVLLATMFLGWRWGLAVVVGCALAGDYLFIRPVDGFSFPIQRTIGAVFFMLSAGLIVAAAQSLRTSVRLLNANAEREATLNKELQHRVKNNLAIVQGLARQTARTSPDPTEFYDAFHGRLMALSQAHDILSTGRWDECFLPYLAEAALKPFDGQGVITLAGPPCKVPANACVPLVLAFHELGTNAVKYGALSDHLGRVSLTWRLEDGAVAFHWEESGGPRVKPPKRKGLGSRLLSKQPGLESVALEFRPEGVSCRITVAGAYGQNEASLGAPKSRLRNAPAGNLQYRPKEVEPVALRS